MKIRAHHLLCIRNFNGKGYNQEFIKNFYDVISTLDKEPIEIITSADLICKKCPHLKGGACKHKEGSERRTEELDIKVIKQAGINKNSFYRYDELKKKVSSMNTITICNDCEWKRLCR